MNAGVAKWLKRCLAKAEIEGSNPFSRLYEPEQT